MFLLFAAMPTVVPQTLGTTLSMGLITIGLLVPAEIAGVVWVRGLSLQKLNRGPPPWQIFLARHCWGYFKGHHAPTKGELLVHGCDDEIRSHEPYGRAPYPPKS